MVEGVILRTVSARFQAIKIAIGHSKSQIGILGVRPSNRLYGSPSFVVENSRKPRVDANVNVLCPR